MAKANDLRNKFSNQSSMLGGAGGGPGGKSSGGQSELSKIISDQAKKKAGAQSTGHILNKQLGGGAGPQGPTGGGGPAKGVPRRPATNKGG